MLAQTDSLTELQGLFQGLKQLHGLLQDLEKLHGCCTAIKSRYFLLFRVLNSVELGSVDGPGPTRLH